MAGNSVGSNSPDGDTLGATTSDPISFYGIAPIAQQTVTAIGTTTISQVGTTGKWAFASSTAALAFVALVRSLKTKIALTGLIG